MCSVLPRSFILLTVSAWCNPILPWGDRDKRGADVLFPLLCLPRALLPLLYPIGCGAAELSSAA